MMRNKEMHFKHCQYIERPGIKDSERDHFSMVYGVNRKSALCELPQFDVTTQLPQDIMHVLFEGVIPLHMGLLLEHVVHSLRVISLAQLNSRIKSHPHGYFEEKPMPLSNFELTGTGTQTGINIDVVILCVACIQIQLHVKTLNDFAFPSQVYSCCYDLQ